MDMCKSCYVCVYVRMYTMYMYIFAETNIDALFDPISLLK